MHSFIFLPLKIYFEYARDIFANPEYSIHVSSIFLYGALEHSDALEVDTYDTRCNRGNAIKRTPRTATWRHEAASECAVKPPDR